MKSFAKQAVAILVISTLAACGGGGGGSTTSTPVAPITTGTGTPTPVNAGIFVQPATPTKMAASAAATSVPAKFAAAVKVSANKNIPVFNPSTTTLTLPNVTLGSKTYSEVQLRHEGNGTFSLLNSPAIDAASPISASSYSTETGVLTMKSVMVDDHRFTNVALHLETDGKFKLVEVNDPILVQKTSYANAKNLNIPSQEVPKLKSETDKFERITGGLAYGDFFQDGNISMVAFSNLGHFYNASTGTVPEQGKIYFFKKVNGQWVDKTKDLLADNAGCISPRKLIVSDFNGDGIPDVYSVCHGSEQGALATWTGENQRVLLSQPDGTYKNTKLDIVCYCHGGASADIDNNGTIDIVTSDGLLGRDGKYAYMRLIGDGSGGFTVDRTPFMAHEAEYNTAAGVNYYYSAFDIELIDINGDGQLDMFVSGSENYMNTYILAGNGSGRFDNIIKQFPKATNEAHVTDMVFVDGVLYEHLYVNNTPLVQVRKYAKDFSSYEVVYSKDGDDFVWFMPYMNTLVSYDSAYGVTINK